MSFAHAALISKFEKRKPHNLTTSQPQMTKETRTNFQVWSAIAMLTVGVALAVAGFIIPPTGEISDSVLWFFSQCLIYAGSIFGIGAYVNGKFGEIRQKLKIKDDPKEQ